MDVLKYKLRHIIFILCKNVVLYLKGIGGEKMRKKIIVRPAEESDLRFIESVLIEYKNNDRFLLGYPRFDSIEELKGELELYESSLKDCVSIIEAESESVGIGGLLFSKEDSYGYFIPPMVKGMEIQKESYIDMVNYVLENYAQENKKVIFVVPVLNDILLSSVKSIGGSYKETQREMCFQINSDHKYTINGVRDVLKSDNNSFKNTIQVMGDIFDWEDIEEYEKEFLDDEYRLSYMMNEKGEIIGGACWGNVNGGDFARLEYVAVKATERGKGYGRTMIEHVINSTKKLGRDKVYLSTEIENDAANLYKSMGFYDTVVSQIYEMKN